MGVRITNSQEALPRARWHFRVGWGKRSSVHSAYKYIKPHSGWVKCWVRGHNGKLAATGISQVSSQEASVGLLSWVLTGERRASVSERSVG